jgi:release factor glutamine methyltransferase
MTPRRATEALVDAALARLGERRARVADVGTGSGAIAVTIAVRAPDAEVWAIDLDDDALALALANARRHGVADRVHVVRGDLLAPAPRPLDLVVANLPYLPDSLRDAAYDTEPDHAIYAPGDGLELYRRLLAEAEEHLAPDGAVVLQFRRQVLEAEREELARVRARLDAAPAR